MMEEQLADGYKPASGWVESDQIRFRVLLYNGAPDSLEYQHECCNGRQREDMLPLRQSWGSGWSLHQLRPVTLAPSILCTSCGLHGWIREGEWVRA